MSSFAGGSFSVTFTVQRDSFAESRQGRVAVQEIPGGDEFFVDLGGRSPLTIKLKAIIPDATSWGALNGAIGTEGLLAIDTLDSHQAVLMNAQRDAPYGPDGQMSANLEFIVVDA